MSLQRIYDGFYKKKPDDYYIRLALDDVMTIPALIDILLNNKFWEAKWSMNILEKLSDKYPARLYPFFPYIIKALDHTESYIVYNCWKIIINILPLDTDDKWSELSDRFMFAFNTDIIAQFFVICECAEKLIKYKPYEREKILLNLSEMENKIFTTSDIIGKIAKEKVALLIDSITNLQSNEN